MYAAIHKKKKKSEADRRYRMRHPDRLRERELRWRLANPEKRKAQKRRWYARHRAEILEHKRRYYARVYPYGKRLALFAMSATAYAEYRAARRIRSARLCVMDGRMYRPRFNRRIPDWATLGQGIDYSSPWLIENLTPAQKAYARELAIERRVH